MGYFSRDDSRSRRKANSNNNITDVWKSVILPQAGQAAWYIPVLLDLESYTGSVLGWETAKGESAEENQSVSLGQSLSFNLT